MITISNASDALKTIYLGVIAEHIDTEKVRKYGRA